MAETFTQEWLRKMWGSGKTFQYKGKRYKVGRMSYGDYYFEPAGLKLRETDYHSPQTLWLEKIDFQKGIYKIDF